MDIKIKNNNKLKLASFTQLEYIESTGTQYINTDIQQNNITAFDLACVFKTISSGNIILGGITGSWNWNDSMLLFYYETGIYVTTGNGSNKNFSNTSLNVKYTINFTNGNITINGSTQTISNLDKSVLLSIFKGGGSYGQCQLFSLKMYKGSNVLRDFIPCKDPNGIICLYDTVSKTFFYNQGTGDFIAGPEVPSIISALPETISIKTTSLYHKNTPNVNGLQLLNSIFNVQKTAEDIVLSRIRVDIGNVSGSLSELLQYAGMAGFNDNYEPQAKPRLVGTWTINDWYTAAQLAQAQATFDGLTIVGDPNYIINFNDLAVQVLDDTQPNYNPGMAIVLQDAGYGVTFDKPQISGQTGRWMLTKTDAANIDSVLYFKGKPSVVDNNKIVSNQQQTYDQTLLNFKFFGITYIEDWYLERTYFSCPMILPDCLAYLRQAFYASNFTYIHFLSTIPPTGNISEYTFSGTYKIYVGDGSSAAHDNTILADYVSATGWSSYSSRLDTWYNYLHPTI